MSLRLNSLRFEVDISAPPDRIWQDISDLSTHIEWMDDATKIEFLGSKRKGVGTFYKCVTKFWKFQLDDQILVTEWDENQRMGIQHDGLVTGNGAFRLIPTETGTKFVWEENLLFPIYFGGPLGEAISRPIFRRVWTSNLASLKDRIEAAQGINPIAFFAERGIELQMNSKRGNWTVDLIASKVSDFHVRDYAHGTSGFAARAAAMKKWLMEEEPV